MSLRERFGETHLFLIFFSPLRDAVRPPPGRKHDNVKDVKGITSALHCRCSPSPSAPPGRVSRRLPRGRLFSGRRSDGGGVSPVRRLGGATEAVFTSAGLFARRYLGSISQHAFLGMLLTGDA